jgi:dTDP-4-amino-4,6-dideoxygalactose transaminase
MIPFLDLKAQYRELKPQMEEAVLGVLESAQYVLGDEVDAFEREFADYCGTRHAIAVNTGTSALHLALLAAGVGPDDEVITTPFTFVATVAAIRYIGARPVFVDIERGTFTLDPSRLEAAITPKTRAIVPVHLYGQMADMDPILDIAHRHGLQVIEDACQAHGAEYKGERAGSLGISGCFSFYPGKNLGAYGEGGMIVTDSDEQMKAMRMLRDWGQDRRYHHILQGYNYRMDAIQGAVLRIKLRHLERWTEGRRANARNYSRLLVGGPLNTPREAPDRRHVWHIYAVRSADRDELQRSLQHEGIQTGLHYPIPVHLQPAHADLGYRTGDFPESEAAANSVLSLPMYAELTARQIETVADAIRQDAHVY